MAEGGVVVDNACYFKPFDDLFIGIFDKEGLVFRNFLSETPIAIHRADKAYARMLPRIKVDLAKGGGVLHVLVDDVMHGRGPWRDGSAGPHQRVHGIGDAAAAHHVDARDFNDRVGGGIDACGFDVYDADQRHNLRDGFGTALRYASNNKHRNRL